jgi:hypothetical protein
MRVVEINGKHRYCVFYRSFEFNYNDLAEYVKRIQDISKEIDNGYSDVFTIFETEIIITYIVVNLAKCEFCIYSKNEQVFL